jgi:hypothetical protein
MPAPNFSDAGPCSSMDNSGLHAGDCVMSDSTRCGLGAPDGSVGCCDPRLRVPVIQAHLLEHRDERCRVRRTGCQEKTITLSQRDERWPEPVIATSQIAGPIVRFGHQKVSRKVSPTRIAGQGAMWLRFATSFSGKV